VTKDELLNALNNVLNSFLYGLMCSRLTPPEKWRDVSTSAVLFEGRDIDIRIALGPLVTHESRNALPRKASGTSISMIRRVQSATAPRRSATVDDAPSHPPE